MRALLFLAVLWSTFAAPVFAAAESGAARFKKFPRDVVVCPAMSAGPPPDKTAPGCRSVALRDVDPQFAHVWVLGFFDLPETARASRPPLAFFLSAKAASAVFVNGILVGSEGAPAASRAAERPGRMDAVLLLPEGLLQIGRNEIAVRMSSHHGMLRLRHPIHDFSLAPYADPTLSKLEQYWPALTAFGALLAGALYFFAAALSGADRVQPALLSLLSLCAAGQLFAEVSRGLVDYAYPFHEIRLMLILAFSGAFGLCLLLHAATKFLDRRRRETVAVGVAATLVLIVAARGFDEKAAAAVLVPALVAVGAAVAGARSRKPQAKIYGVALGIFAATIIVLPAAFLDALFFIEVAALVLILFCAQALAFAGERRAREEERVRAAALETALARAAEADRPSVVRVNAAGGVNVVPAAEIAFGKGAGDYVELHLLDGRAVLHSGALADLETALPPGFLRVHRSFVVNTGVIRELKREASGVGSLVLSNGAEIPVSRRIMPKVRAALR